MDHRMAPPPKQGMARLACAGLCLAWLLAFEPLRSADAHAVPSVDSALPSHRQRCNPPPEATTEDMGLAIAVLQDTTQMGHWRNVAWYLGELGFPQCFEPLRDFIWASHGQSDTSRYMLDAMTSAQTSIGHVAASSPAALDYLIQSTNPSFWKSLRWRDPRRTAEELRLEMSKASIKALGLSGAAEAGQMLSRLRRWPYAEAQQVAIKDAFRSFRYITLVRRYSPEELRPTSRVHLGELLPPATDSSLIYGKWRWMRTSYSTGGRYAPPTCGWSRTLVLEPDSTYSLLEEDSADVYRICSGEFKVHTTAKGPWIEFEGWSWKEPSTYWPTIRGPGLLVLRPGGAHGVWHSLGPTHTFAREAATTSSSQWKSAKTWRPPRIRRTSGERYSIEMPPPFHTLASTAQSRRWNYSRLTPKGYEYTHYQIPSGVIGDFDADSMADAAILGYDDDNKNVITCLLSNRGAPRAVVAWTERGSGTKEGPTRPLHYLKLVPAGRSHVDSRGNRTVLATDAIWVVGREGGSSILSYANGLFHSTSLAAARGGGRPSR
jgi:hypothetical protein